jgi:hypothetical protein
MRVVATRYELARFAAGLEAEVAAKVHHQRY